MLKPVDGELEVIDWIAEHLAAISERGFRVSRPIPTATGAWRCDGWTASRFVAGAEPDHRRAPQWAEIIAAGDAFHRALTHVPRPAFSDRRTDPWKLGDYAAWEETAPVGTTHAILPGLVEPYERLTALRRPLPDLRRQLIHGDLTGNVLLAQGQCPAVIDFSAYWRPADFGAAIVVGDAVLWSGAGTDLIGWSVEQRGGDFFQHVVRAVIYRLVTANEFTVRAGNHAASPGEVDNYGRAAALLTSFDRTHQLRKHLT